MKAGELPLVYASLSIAEDRESAEFWVTDGETGVTIPLTRRQAGMVGQTLMDYADGRRDTAPVEHEEVF